MYFLENYLRIIASKPYCINSIYVKNFLELEHHFPDYNTFQPMLLSIINDAHFRMDITDIVYQDFLFVGFAMGTSTTVLSTYFNNIRSIFNNSTLGGLSIYSISQSDYGELLTKKLFGIQLASQVSKIIYKDGVLLVALYNGNVNIYKVEYVDEIHVDKVGSMKLHNHKIIDMGVNYRTGYMYSAAVDERNVVISEVNYTNVIKTTKVSNFPIVQFHYDNVNGRIIFIDEVNELHILEVMENVYPLFNI
jgi:hypothetical protein